MFAGENIFAWSAFAFDEDFFAAAPADHDADA
jgi:hypothetical protein